MADVTDPDVNDAGDGGGPCKAPLASFACPTTFDEVDIPDGGQPGTCGVLRILSLPDIFGGTVCAYENQDGGALIGAVTMTDEPYFCGATSFTAQAGNVPLCCNEFGAVYDALCQDAATFIPDPRPTDGDTNAQTDGSAPRD